MVAVVVTGSPAGARRLQVPQRPHSPSLWLPTTASCSSRRGCFRRVWRHIGACKRASATRLLLLRRVGVRILGLVVACHIYVRFSLFGRGLVEVECCSGLDVPVACVQVLFSL